MLSYQNLKHTTDRTPIPTGEKFIDEGRAWERCLCGAVNKPGEDRCFNSAHAGNVQAKALRMTSADFEALTRTDEQRFTEAAHAALESIKWLEVACARAEVLRKRRARRVALRDARRRRAAARVRR